MSMSEWKERIQEYNPEEAVTPEWLNTLHEQLGVRTVAADVLCVAKGKVEPEVWKARFEITMLTQLPQELHTLHSRYPPYAFVDTRDFGAQKAMQQIYYSQPGELLTSLPKVKYLSSRATKRRLQKIGHEDPLEVSPVSSDIGLTTALAMYEILLRTQSEKPKDFERWLEFDSLDDFLGGGGNQAKISTLLYRRIRQCLVDLGIPVTTEEFGEASAFTHETLNVLARAQMQVFGQMIGPRYHEGAPDFLNAVELRRLGEAIFPVMLREPIIERMARHEKKVKPDAMRTFCPAFHAKARDPRTASGPRLYRVTDLIDWLQRPLYTQWLCEPARSWWSKLSWLSS